MVNGTAVKSLNDGCELQQRAEISMPQMSSPHPGFVQQGFEKFAAVPQGLSKRYDRGSYQTPYASTDCPTTDADDFYNDESITNVQLSPSRPYPAQRDQEEASTARAHVAEQYVPRFEGANGIVDVPIDGPLPHKPAKTGEPTAPSPGPSAPIQTQPRNLWPEKAVLQELFDAYEQAKDGLEKAQAEFDRRDKQRDRENYSNTRALRRSNGAESIPQVVFDQQWVVRIATLARQLTEAEETFSNAKVAAVNAGWHLNDPDTSSVFEDQDSDGYSPSLVAG